MRLTDEQIQERKNGLLEGKAILHGRRGEDMFDTLLDYIDTIEALQQENEQLKDENASIRNWNACEEKLHNELLESDKRRWELESELEDANNYREGLEAIVDKLREQVKTYVEAKIQDYHNPADVAEIEQRGEWIDQQATKILRQDAALAKAREALISSNQIQMWALLGHIYESCR